MAMKLKINENFKSRRKWRSEDVSKKRRIRFNYVSSFYKRPRTKFAFRWKVVDGVECFDVFFLKKKRKKKLNPLVNFQTSKFGFVWICSPFDLLSANNFERVKFVIYTIDQA